MYAVHDGVHRGVEINRADRCTLHEAEIGLHLRVGAMLRINLCDVGRVGAGARLLIVLDVFAC